MYLCITERNARDHASNALLCKTQCLLRIPIEIIGKQNIEETKVRDRNEFFQKIIMKSQWIQLGVLIRVVSENILSMIENGKKS